MNDYLIATASTCDIDAGWLNEHNVPFISYSFIIDDVPYEDDCKEETKQFVRNIATGATMPSINTKFMGEIPIRVPSLETQNKIASILWMIDDKIELNEKINENLAA